MLYELLKNNKTGQPVLLLTGETVEELEGQRIMAFCQYNKELPPIIEQLESMHFESLDELNRYLLYRAISDTKKQKPAEPADDSKAANEQGLSSKITFGKHKNKTVREVFDTDPKWLLWAHDNVSFFSLNTRILGLLLQKNCGDGNDHQSYPPIPSQAGNMSLDEDDDRIQSNKKRIGDLGLYSNDGENDLPF